MLNKWEAFLDRRKLRKDVVNIYRVGQLLSQRMKSEFNTTNITSNKLPDKLQVIFEEYKKSLLDFIKPNSIKSHINISSEFKSLIENWGTSDFRSTTAVLPEICLQFKIFKRQAGVFNIIPTSSGDILVFSLTEWFGGGLLILTGLLIFLKLVIVYS